MYSITASRCFAPREMQTNVLSTMILDSRQSDKELQCLQYANFTRFYRSCSIDIGEERYNSIRYSFSKKLIEMLYYLLFYLSDTILYHFLFTLF